MVISRGDFRAALALVDEAFPYAKAAVDAKPRHPFYQAVFRNVLQKRADAFLGLGDHALAAGIAEQMTKLVMNPALDHYNAACVLARSATVAQKDPKLSASERTELARKYEIRAVAGLAQAVAAGFADAAHMKEDPDVASLRQRDDFKKLLGDLEAKHRTKG